MTSVMEHPATALMADVEAERAIAATPEAQALRHAIYKAISDYWDYLDRHGLIYEETRDMMRASGLHITYNANWGGDQQCQ
jgi:hypothetical protein